MPTPLPGAPSRVPPPHAVLLALQVAGTLFLLVRPAQTQCLGELDNFIDMDSAGLRVSG